MREKIKLYGAGPWFSSEQDERELRVKAKLRELGFEVFSPREASSLPKDASVEDQEEVFRVDIEGILDADAVFAITNGKDMGTIFECGYAYAKGIPVFYFAEGLTGQFNLMLARSGKKAYTNLDDVTYEEIAELINSDSRVDYKGEIE